MVIDYGMEEFGGWGRGVMTVLVFWGVVDSNSRWEMEIMQTLDADGY